MMNDRYSILFVDDDPNVLSGLRRTLRAKAADWDMHFAASGPEGLALLDQRPVDVVISDMRMPGMDGARFLSEIMSRSPDTIRFVLSGQSDDESIFRSVGLCHQYLSKPCEAQALAAKINNALALRERMQNDNLRRLMTAKLRLPSNPERFRKIIGHLQSTEVPTSVVAADIESDPGLAALVLQVANSAFFGPARSISNISQAVSFLGFDIIKALVLKNDLLQLQIPEVLPPGMAQSVFRHCEDTAAIARLLARRESLPPGFADDCYAAGLLHDLGRLLLASADPKVFARYNLSNAPDEDLPGLERAAFGVTHSDAVGYVLGLWGLPNPLVEAVVFHHDTEFAMRATNEPVFFVFIANWIMGHWSKSISDDHDIIAALAAVIGDQKRAAGMIEAVETSGLGLIED